MRLILTIIILCLLGCGRQTKDAQKAFEYWAGGLPSGGVIALEGNYWKSMHFTYEYEVFLHLKAPKHWPWLNEFFTLNKIAPAKVKYVLPDNAPAWFSPPNSGVVYSKADTIESSFYVVDTLKGEVYVYEIQL